MPPNHRPEATRAPRQVARALRGEKIANFLAASVINKRCGGRNA